MLNREITLTENQANLTISPELIEPAFLKNARQLYHAYCESHAEHLQRPLGVVINRINHRGKLIFSKKPVLLPQEYFVPFSQIASQLR